MLEVFIDRACALGREPRVRALGPVTLDAADAVAVNRLAGGGILLVGARTSDGVPSISSIRAIRRAYPHVVIVLCAEWREVGQVALAHWTVAGVDEFVTFGWATDVAAENGTVLPIPGWPAHPRGTYVRLGSEGLPLLSSPSVGPLAK